MLWWTSILRRKTHQTSGSIIQSRFIHSSFLLFVTSNANVCSYVDGRLHANKQRHVFAKLPAVIVLQLCVVYMTATSYSKTKKSNITKNSPVTFLVLTKVCLKQNGPSCLLYIWQLSLAVNINKWNSKDKQICHISSFLKEELISKLFSRHNLTTLLNLKTMQQVWLSCLV